MSTAKTPLPRRTVRRRNLHRCLTIPAASSLCTLFLLTTSGSVWAQDFASPTRIAHGAAIGEVLVVDSVSQAILSNATDKKGRQVTISVPGRPVSVAYGWQKYFVGNESTQTVDVVNKKGRLLYTLGGDDFLVQRPSDIAVDIDQEFVFVSDPLNSRVLKFHQDGALLGTFQSQLYMPTGLAVDPVRGEVLVSDFGLDGEATINIYDYSGALLTQVFGNAGCGWFSCTTGPGNFSRPQGITVNEQGLIYVVDSFRGQVLVFDRDTQQSVAVIGVQGTGPGELLLPLDVLIEPQSKDLHVTSNRTRRVEVFSGKGLLP